MRPFLQFVGWLLQVIKKWFLAGEAMLMWYSLFWWNWFTTSIREICICWQTRDLELVGIGPRKSMKLLSDLMLLMKGKWSWYKVIELVPKIFSPVVRCVLACYRLRIVINYIVRAITVGHVNSNDCRPRDGKVFTGGGTSPFFFYGHKWNYDFIIQKEEYTPPPRSGQGPHN